MDLRKCFDRLRSRKVFDNIEHGNASEVVFVFKCRKKIVNLHTTQPQIPSKLNLLQAKVDAPHVLKTEVSEVKKVGAVATTKVEHPCGPVSGQKRAHCAFKADVFGHYPTVNVIKR